MISFVGEITTDLGEKFLAGRKLPICILKFNVILFIRFQVFNLMELVRVGQEVKWWSAEIINSNRPFDLAIKIF